MAFGVTVNRQILIGLALGLAACNRAPLPVASEAATPVVTQAPSAVVAPDPTLGARSTLKKWNDAHVNHDSKALEAVYAPTIRFYGQQLSASECVKRKAAAFAKSPDYSQTIRNVAFVQQGGGYLLRFTKTSTSHGKSTDYPSFIVVVADRVTEESDDLTDESLRAQATLAVAKKLTDDWCIEADGFPNDTITPPFKTSANRAMVALWKSKHVEALGRTLGQIGIDAPMGCPTVCSDAPAACGLRFRVVDMSQVGVTTSIMREWIYVDAVKNVRVHIHPRRELIAGAELTRDASPLACAFGGWSVRRQG
jgi:hypothetical protein